MDAQGARHSVGNARNADLIEARDRLVRRIADAVASQGYYLAHLEAPAGQVLTDLRWAAQLAGRAVGRRTRTYASTIGKRVPGKVTVIVAPVEIWSASEVPGRDAARAVIEDLLQVHIAVSARNRPA